MDIILVPALQLLKAIIGLLVWIILADVLISWLLSADILNVNNRIVYVIVSSISRIADSALDLVRRKMPVYAGTVDLSPVIVILLLKFIEGMADRIIIRYLI
ncbi:MAG: YggT family protein [Holosporaceae bacterium]|jgi:YggT family protein|nr:YggT family protein [Holosporaceae bacterium]